MSEVVRPSIEFTRDVTRRYCASQKMHLKDQLHQNCWCVCLLRGHVQHGVNVSLVVATNEVCSVAMAEAKSKEDTSELPKNSKDFSLCPCCWLESTSGLSQNVRWTFWFNIPYIFLATASSMQVSNVLISSTRKHGERPMQHSKVTAEDISAISGKKKTCQRRAAPAPSPLLPRWWIWFPHPRGSVDGCAQEAGCAKSSDMQRQLPAANSQDSGRMKHTLLVWLWVKKNMKTKKKLSFCSGFPFNSQVLFLLGGGVPCFSHRHVGWLKVWGSFFLGGYRYPYSDNTYWLCICVYVIYSLLNSSKQTCICLQ